MATTQCVLITTTDTDEEAERLARGLIDQRLAACVQLSRIVSHYRWQGEVVRSDEVRLDIKTLVGKVGAVQAYIEANHSYATPELIELPVTSGLPGYLRWMEDSLR